MKIGIIDADLLDNGTRHPNLSLMKISAYNKVLGNDTVLLNNYNEITNYDHVYISKVFSFTKTPGDLLNNKKVTIGGTGFFEDGGQSLVSEIEHHFPDYNLYDDFINKEIELGAPRKRFSDYLDYSIGFTTRGCFRKCEFCVNKKYDRVQIHSPVLEFLDKERSKIYLWDDNFLAFKDWKSVLSDLENTKKPFQFRQGLDIRLMTSEKAERLSEVKYSGDYIFAFDHVEDRCLIEDKLKIWKQYSKKTTKLYVLTGYDSQDEIDIINTFERIKILMVYGCLPYIMRYEAYKESKFKGMYIQIARWCNQPQFFKKKSFRQFCVANQEYHKNKNTLCAAYKAMIEFEKEFPEIAKFYFDLRFEDIRKY
jgi:hypothetical protein